MRLRRQSTTRWHQEMGRIKPDNVTIIRAELNAAYPKMAASLPEEFDVIVIDARCRTACAKNALPALEDTGIIVWDDSERARYEEGYAFLSDRGFNRLDFWEIGPTVVDENCTSVFYRDVPARTALIDRARNNAISALRYRGIAPGPSCVKAITMCTRSSGA